MMGKPVACVASNEVRCHKTHRPGVTAMEIEFKGNEIVFNKPLSDLDRLVFKFVGVLEGIGIKYVIISGYVAILFGRSRQTEDVDIFLEPLDEKRFFALWRKLEENEFECINAFSGGEALHEFLQKQLAIRFAEKGDFEPNFEVKFPKTDLNRFSLANRIKVKVGDNFLYTSNLELQVAFKLYLGSDKDIEDAIHLWETFKKNLDHDYIARFAERLGVQNRLKELGETK